MNLAASDQDRKGKMRGKGVSQEREKHRISKKAGQADPGWGFVPLKGLL